MNAETIPDKELSLLTDSKSYSDHDLLIYENNLYLQRIIQKQFDDFNRSIGNLPAQAQQAIDSVDSHVRSQGNKFTPVNKRMADIENKHEEMVFSLKLLSYIFGGSFFAMLALQGLGFWVILSRLS